MKLRMRVWGNGVRSEEAFETGYYSLAESVTRLRSFWEKFQDSWSSYHFKMVTLYDRKTGELRPNQILILGQFAVGVPSVESVLNEPSSGVQLFEGSLTKDEFSRIIGQLEEETITVADTTYNLPKSTGFCHFEPFEDRQQTWEMPEEALNVLYYGLLSWQGDHLDVDVNQIGRFATLNGYNGGFRELLRQELELDEEYSCYRIVLPLPVRAEAEHDEQRQVLQCRVSCRAPLDLDECTVSVGQSARKSQSVEFKRDSQCRDGWQSGIGESEQIQDRPTVWFKNDKFTQDLDGGPPFKLRPFKISVTRRPKTIINPALDIIYGTRNNPTPGLDAIKDIFKGLEGKQPDNKDADKFEFAIANALVALGYRVYFGGTVTQSKGADCIAIAGGFQSILVISATLQASKVGEKIKTLIEVRRQRRSSFLDVDVKWVIAVPEPLDAIPWSDRESAADADIYVCHRDTLEKLMSNIETQTDASLTTWLQEAAPTRIRDRTPSDDLGSSFSFPENGYGMD